MYLRLESEVWHRSIDRDSIRYEAIKAVHLVVLLFQLLLIGIFDLYGYSVLTETGSLSIRLHGRIVVPILALSLRFR